MRAVLRHLLSPVYDDSLAPAHRDDLAKSGITEAARRAQGIRSVPPNDFEPLLSRRSVPSGTRSMLLLPFPSPAGGWFDHFQVKLFPPHVDSKGHSVKYLQLRGSTPRLYFVRSVLPPVLAPASPLWVVEGAKKSITAAQLGLPAVGITGIEGWHARGSRRLLFDFDTVPLAGRVVKVVPDGDVQTNPAVERGTAGFAEALEQRGARVRIVLLPVAATA
jgi:hypothetical protein